MQRHQHRESRKINKHNIFQIKAQHKFPETDMSGDMFFLEGNTVLIKITIEFRRALQKQTQNFN